MQLHTPVNIAPPPFRLDYRQPMLVVGSCFATNIGERLQQLKFPATINPFGVVYNPLSIANSLSLLMDGRLLSETDLHHANGCWFSFYHHSSYSSPSKEEALSRMNASLHQAATALQTLDVLVLTLGTARVYEYKESGQVVNNCHKLPANQFTHRLLSVDEVYSCLHSVLQGLQQLRPQLKIVLTVSPIRHIKDGAHGNQLSKATLLLSVDALCRQFSNAYYFPAYELMMDELRDYRFYADDMLHPSPAAVSYIWKRFAETVLSAEAQQIIPELEKLIAAKQHRPFNPHTEEHTSFKRSFYQRASQLQQRYPFLDLSDELQYFRTT